MRISVAASLLLVVMVPSTGCMSRAHKRPVEVAGQVAFEKFRIVSLLQDAKAAQVDATLTDGDYSYNVGAREVEFLADEEFIGRIADRVAEVLSGRLTPTQ